MDREDLLTEVNAYLERLCGLGDVSGIFAAFGSYEPDIQALPDGILKEIYDEFINDD